MRLRGTIRHLLQSMQQTLHLDFASYFGQIQTWIIGSSLIRLFPRDQCPVDFDAALELHSLTSLHMLIKVHLDHWVLSEPLLLHYLEVPLLERLIFEGVVISLEQILISYKPRFPNLSFLTLYLTALAHHEGVPWIHASKCFPSVKHLTQLQLSHLEPHKFLASLRGGRGRWMGF